MVSWRALGALVVATLIVAAVHARRAPPREPLPPTVPLHRAPPFAMPDFALVDQHGVRLRRADLLGRVWVAAFVFTECSELCSTVSRHMLAVMRDRPALRFVSFSVGETDGPRELGRFADRLPERAEVKARWQLLAADASFPSLAADLGLAATAEGARTGSMILFPALYLVDRDGTVVRVYDGFGEDGPRRLADDLATLTAQNP
jgi:protein SCO1/2